MNRPSPEALDAVSTSDIITRNIDNIIKDFFSSTGLVNESQNIIDSSFIVFVCGMISVMNAHSEFNKNYCKIPGERRR